MCRQSREEGDDEGERSAWACLLAGQLLVHFQSADTVQAQNEIVSLPSCPLCLHL